MHGTLFCVCFIKKNINIRECGESLGKYSQQGLKDCWFIKRRCKVKSTS